ncbi:MAG: DUF1134 domain-containing protein [Sphingomonadales bacterium]|jgi:hypothetical protein
MAHPKNLKTIFTALTLVGTLAISGCSSSSSTRSVSANQRTQTTEAGYDQETVLDAAKDVFGDGAEGLAGVIENLFSELGRPNAYIAGEEAGGGIVAALRYGGGTLYHKIEGERPVHWAGPSVGFEFGGDAAKAFILVYNLYDTQNLYRRYPAAEGQFYFVGGLGVSYYQRDDIIIVPIRLGVGLRATANVGYIKFTEDQTLNPF